MALFDEDGVIPEAITKQPSQTATRYEPLEGQYTAITTIDGTPLEGTYYSQILGQVDQPRVLDLALDPTLQQYRKINRFPLMLESELTVSNDAQSGMITVTGSGIIYPGITPNYGDMFVATLPDLNVALLYVKSSERITYTKTSAYKVEIALFTILTETQKGNLEAKKAEEYYFDNETKSISITSHHTTSLFKVNVGKLVSMYYDEFYDSLSETLLVPDETYRIYDPHMTKFWSEFVGQDLRGAAPKVRIYTCATGAYKRKTNTVLDELISGTRLPSYTVHKYMKRSHAYEFSSDRIFYSIYTAPISYVIWPKDADTVRSEKETVNEVDDLPYIFTRSFYLGSVDTMTVLEKAVYSFLNGRVPARDEIVTLINTLLDMTPLERFYALPVMLLLYRAAVN